MKGLALRLVLIVCSGALGLLAAEFSARVSGRAPDVLKIRPGMKDSAFANSANPILGYELTKNFRHDSPNNIENYAYINAAGQRDIERDTARTNGKPRVLLLGDSVAMGLGIADLDHTISRRMEELFEGSVEVLNFGVAGYCTRGQVELLETKGLGYEPDAVIVLFVDNDYEDSNSQASYYKFDRPKWTERMFMRSDLFRLVALRFDWWHFRAEVDKEYGTHRNQTALRSNSVEIGVRRLKELSLEHEFEALIAVWPTFAKKSAVDRLVPHAADSPQAPLRIEKLAEEAGLSTLRLSTEFQADYRDRVSAGEARKPDELYTRDDPRDNMHPNELGAEVTAEILKRTLEADPRYLAGE